MFGIAPSLRRVAQFLADRKKGLGRPNFQPVANLRLALAVAIAASAVLALSSRVARVQTPEQTPVAGPQAAPATRSVTVHAASQSSALVHLRDGYELNSGGQPGGSPVSLAASDFDDDGTPDLVTGYANGKLVLRRGNPDAVYPQGSLSNPHTQQRKANGRFTEEAFFPDAQIFDVPESADVIEAGDFNADGHQDVLVVARNSNSIYLLAGSGNGTFQAARQIEVKGQVTAMAAGEIGQADGQTDVAIGVITEKGPQLLVYEHPEGAFKHAPEIFPLAAPATDIVIGELDGDSFSDIAVATGNALTIIHGRGQAYPWDLIKEVNIQRPAAIVATRELSFPIAALTIGQFGDGRGNSLAVLAGDGSLYMLEPTQTKTAKTTLAHTARAADQSVPSLPTGVAGTGLAVRTRPRPKGKTAQADGLLVRDSPQSHADRNALIKKAADEAAGAMAKLSQAEIAQLKIGKKAEAAMMREQAKQSFLRTISAQPASLAKWNLQPVVTDTRLSAMDQATAKRLITARVSVSGRDDLVVLDTVGQQLQIVSRQSSVTGDQSNEQSTTNQAQSTNHGPLTAKITSLSVDAGPTAVLPMRLNGDALSDLVVLRHGASQPSVVLTAATAVFEVNDTGDQLGNCLGGGTCTLRSAIIAANGSPGSQITFNIPGAGVHTISPLTQLPVITANGTDVHASTQPGFAGFPLIEIKGNLIQGTADGIKVRANGCYVGSFAINQFPFKVSGISYTGGSGITIETQTGSSVISNNFVVGNFLGTDPTGFVAKGGAHGLLIFTANNTVVNGNLLSANAGYGLNMTNGNNSSIRSNRIGTAVDGLTKLGNVEGGVFLTGSDNQFGGDGGGNTVSGNGKPIPDGFPSCVGGEGVLIPALYNPDTGQVLTQSNEVKGNRIGTSFDGLHPVGNCHAGIDTDPLATTVIGSIAPNGRNIVSDNGLGAISCLDSIQINFGDAPSEGGYCKISGNNIGTDITGTVALPNDARNLGGGLVAIPFIVEILNSNTLSNFGAPGGTTPGGDCTGFCNLLSGNRDSEALFIGNHGTVGAFNNYVGTNQSGTQALPNTSGGIVAAPYFGDAFIGAVGDQFGLPGTSLGNLSASGVGAECPLFCFGDLTIEGNLFGTGASGLNAIPSGGVSIFGVGGDVQIGGADPLARNVISSSTGDGLFLNFNFSDGIKIVDNYIGVNQAGAPLGNAGAGIAVMNYGAATIGGSTAEEENIIQNNGGSGIRVASSGSGLPSGVNIQRNKISSNGKLGIDLSNGGFTDDGVTENDCEDSDTGPNELQNYPLLGAPTFNGDGTVTVSASLNSEPLRDYRIDFYYSSSVDSTNYGEGENFIGSKTVTTNSNGGVAFDFTSATAAPAGSLITATATNDLGSTSEFSCAAGVCVGQTVENGKLAPSSFCPFKNIVVNVTGDEPEDPASQGTVCNVDLHPIAGQERCTLRAAIELALYRAHHQLGKWTILFGIPGAGVHTISPQSPLPPIDKPVIILGGTQSAPDAHLIEINGANAGVTDGLVLAAGSDTSFINELTINHFQGAGISVINANDVRVTGCYLGLNSSGSGAASIPTAAQTAGILVTNSNRTRIGGFSSHADINVISGNQVGVKISGGSMNVLLANRIGTDRLGDAKVPNQSGVLIDTSDGNDVGGEIAGATPEEGLLKSGNLISGNTGDGVVITSSKNNILAGNFIGTDLLGTSRLENGGSGIRLGAAAGNNRIGGSVLSERNVISGQNAAGAAGVVILKEAADGNQILGNYIGVDVKRQSIGPDNVSLVGNTNGILLQGNNASVVKNVISGNTEAGILVGPGLGGGYSPTGNKIKANLIGTVSANRVGISLVTSKATIIGGADADANVIVNSVTDGIRVGEGSTTNEIANNLIGILADGTSPTPNTITNNKNGILLLGSENSVIGNTISFNTEIGIRVEHGSSDPADQVNHIEGNFIGTSKDGKTAAANRFTGILLTNGARANRIEKMNLISGNSTGVQIGALESGNLVTLNVVDDNYIGTNAAGDSALKNGDGIVLSSGAERNFIGGDEAEGKGNVISGNGHNGILIASDGNPISPPALNEVRRNKIGMNASVTNPHALPNEIGVMLGYWANRNTIGGSLAFNSADHEGNLISGNSSFGIKICPDGGGIGGTCSEVPQGAPFNNTVQGNVIGLTSFTADGKLDGNGSCGIFVKNSAGNMIGGVHTEITRQVDDGNVVGNNGNVDPDSRDGIRIEGTGSAGAADSNQIIKNYVGVTPEGALIENAGNGITIKNAHFTQVNLNWISGNNLNGLLLQNIPPGLPEVANAIVQGNLIGLAEKPTGIPIFDVPNNLAGIRIEDASGVIIGGATASTPGNTIGGNSGDGILITGGGSVGNRAFGNYIGTDTAGHDLGNIGHGILITNHASSNRVGYKDVPVLNNFWFNGKSGAVVDNSAGLGNLIDPNSFFANGLLGIDLGGSGEPLPNDPGDADDGPNHLQNFPEFSSAVIDGNGELIILYKIDSAPENSNYGDDGIYVEFFKADASLQGQTFIGSSNYTVGNYESNDHPGLAQFDAGNAASLGIHVGDKLVATATDADENTSEFTSTNVGVVVGSAPTAAPARVSGQVTTSDGQPLAGVSIKIDGAHSATTITDRAGRYAFESIETANFYVVTPQRANYSFSPGNRSFSLVANKTDAIFTASADAAETANPLETPEFFVRQQYLDFLSREPDAGGFNYWAGTIDQCGANASCLREKRIDVSNAFFYEQEFQDSGAFIYRVYKTTLGQAPTFAQFEPDRAAVVGGANLEQSKLAYALAFVQRDAFRAAYPDSQTAEQFVDALLITIKQHSSVDLSSQRDSLVTQYDGADNGRAAIIRQLADNRSLVDAEYNASFVLTQYFGYLRRDPEAGGFNFWLGTMNSAPLRDVGKQHALVCSFITSTEYQQRFSLIVTHSNSECSP
jgi:parallel beta-helix repeat protein